jgi:hypothetical protein
MENFIAGIDEEVAGCMEIPAGILLYTFPFS